MEITTFVIKTDHEAEPNSGRLLRGAIAARKKENVELHNHVIGGGYLYRYPLVQYKIINGVPVVVAIGETADYVRKALDGLDRLLLGNTEFRVLGVLEKRQEANFAPCKPRKYRFLTPYIALNSKNLQKYKKFKQEKAWLYLRDLQESILIGNVLSACKGLKVVVENALRAKFSLKEQVVYYRGINAIGFVGTFSLNYSLPDFIGLGRGVSEGWGTIESLQLEE